MSIVSYAQNFEDVMLWRALGSVDNGRYIDIGAQDPLVDSVSLMFYERGWRGIHVEPTPPYAELLRQGRPDEIVIQAAVAGKSGIMSFYEFPTTGLSTGSPEIAEKHINSGFGVREIVVPAVTLDEVLSHESGQELHWLKIDVEGGEKQVLEGWIHSSLRPWVVLIESTAPLSKVETHKQWEPLILSKGYKFAYFDGLNRFYVADGHAELLRAFASGPNVFDDFTLNGTASAPLCAALNSRIRSLEDQGERERQKLEASEAEAARIAQDLAVQERVFSAQLHASQQQIRKLGEQLRERDREAIVSEQRNSAHVRRLEEQIKTVETRERERQTEFVRLEQTRANLELQLAEQLRMERDANHQLQHELAVIRRALSWRLTAPFRTIAGWFYPARLPSKDSLVTGSLHSTPKVTNTGNGATSETMRISSNFSEHAIETDEIKAAPALEILLAYQDRVFVDCAYLTLLRRSPEPSGRDYYLRRLRDGVPKVQILSEIFESPEARLINVVVPGLNDAIRRYRRKHKLVRLPLFGRFLKLFFKPEGSEIAENRLRVVEQQVFRFAGSADARLNSIENGLSDLRELIVRQGQKFAAITEKIAEISSGNHSPQLVTRRLKPIERLALDRERVLYYYVDHTVKCSTNTGVQRVARRLAGALLAAGEQIIFVKWDADRQELVRVSRGELEHLSKWNGPRVSRAEMALYTAAEMEGAIATTHELAEGSWLIVPEVTHMTFHPSPVTIDVLASARRRGLRSAFVYHDAIPLRRPEHASAASQHEIYMQQMLLVDLVVPVSQWVANDLVWFFREHDHASLSPTPKVTSIPLPGESQVVPRVTKPALVKECDHLILSVGTIEARKNQVTLLHAFEAFCKKNPNTDWQLFLAGNLHPDVAPEIARAVALNPNIRYLQHVPDEELDALYRRCAFTVFPSVEEGFGLPIVESLWYAKPCICADFGAMNEVAMGGGCLTIDTRSEREVLRGVESLIESPDLCEQLSREAVARHFTDWSSYVDRLTKEMDAIVSPITRLGPVYYWVDHTCSYPVNSGIQRVVRGLARALIELDVELIPIKWDTSAQRIAPVSSAELGHLSKWNGPSADKWSKWRDPRQSRGWVLVPELTTYLSESDTRGFREFLSLAGLRSAWIFFDAIPWKMRDIYPVEAANAHQKYMSGLNRQELVLAISNFSFRDLVGYLARQPDRTPSLFERIWPCILPGEFTESPRVTLVKESSDRTVTILCVCTVEPRKNHLVLLDAFKKLRLMANISVELVIAGGAPFPELSKKVESFIASEPQIRWVKSPDDRELGELYEKCDFTVYPSIEEGFGLPILESLWHARPCVCASFGAMGEVAEGGGGCLVTDVRDRSQLADAMLRLVEDQDLRQRLMIEATKRQVKTWRDYALEVASRMASERVVPLPQNLPATPDRRTFYNEFVNLKPRPKLSICITTYNRAAWLGLNLRNLTRLWPEPSPDVEFVVCDNTSTDNTPEVVTPYLGRADFRYIRNARNVGMLGNLRVTANHARGEYIWILGDDDLVCSGAIERVLNAIRDHSGTALVYLNYSYTRIDDANAVKDLDKFLKESTPIVAPGADQRGSIREICAQSENFFTAIYCLVFRRDHAIRAYTQNTSGRPFSTLLTCIPTTYYVLNHMIDEPACWVGTPTLVVNMNVSWMKYAPLWILERIPEVYDLAERLGADRAGIDRWRKHNLPGIVHHLKEIFENDIEGNIDYFSMPRLMSRLKGLEGIDESIESIRSIYRSFHEAGHPAAQTSVEEVFAGFN
jgi:FkbM family methyltransferase